MDAAKNRIYSATYSNVPVYECNVEGNHVMRRRSDHWINATHILKVAGYDKPARTRILEREVQKGVHEKVQGGYGKYQGTWISLEDGRILAQRNGCLDKLLPIFNFQPGDRSPPPAPKHMTAQTSKPKVPRAMAPPRRVPVPSQPRMSEASFDVYSSQANEEVAPDQITVSSESETEYPGNIRWPTQSRKRKRGMEQPQQPQQPPQISQEDQQHLMWSDDLLDYFMLQRGDEAPPPVPQIPDGISLNRSVDDKGNTALHWAAAMGDMHLVQEFIHRGASIDVLTSYGATPLVHAVTFTNNYDKQTMGRLAEYLYPTIGQRDCCAATAFHHIAASTLSKTKYQIARYYLYEILERLKQNYDAHDIGRLLDLQDEVGNTAALVAAKNGARKCVRMMTAYGARVDIPNHAGETAEKYIKDLNDRRRDRHPQFSSSPPPPNGIATDGPLAKPAHFPPSQTRPGQYASEAAALLASQLPTLITSRTEALAAAYETELTERETEAREGERLLELRRQELSTLRKQGMSLSVQDQDDVRISVEQADLDHTLDDSRRLLLEEQSLDLRSLVAKYRNARQSPSTDEGSPPDLLSRRVDLAHNVARQQQRAQGLIEDVMDAQGLASKKDHRREIYRQLIMCALGVKADEVEGMLEDILGELEERGPKEGSGDEAGGGSGGGGRSDAGMAGEKEALAATVRMALPRVDGGVGGAVTEDVVYAPVQVAG